MFVLHCLLDVTTKAFGAKMADELSRQDLERYALKRQKAGYSTTTVNRVFQVIRRAYTLAGMTPPEIELFSEADNVREGVITPAEFEKLVEQLPDDGLRDYVRFALRGSLNIFFTVELASPSRNFGRVGRRLAGRQESQGNFFMIFGERPFPTWSMPASHKA